MFFLSVDYLLLLCFFLGEKPDCTGFFCRSVAVLPSFVVFWTDILYGDRIFTKKIGFLFFLLETVDDCWRVGCYRVDRVYRVLFSRYFFTSFLLVLSSDVPLCAFG